MHEVEFFKALERKSGETEKTLRDLGAGILALAKHPGADVACQTELIRLSAQLTMLGIGFGAVGSLLAVTNVAGTEKA